MRHMASIALCVVVTLPLAGCARRGGDAPPSSVVRGVGHGEEGVDTIEAKLAAQEALRHAVSHNETQLRRALADRVAMGELGGAGAAEMDAGRAARELLSLPKAPNPEDIDVRITGASSIGDVAEVEGYVLYKPLAETKSAPEVGGTVRPAALPVRVEVRSVGGELRITKLTFEESPELDANLPDGVWRLAELMSEYQARKGRLPDTPGDLVTFWATEHAHLRIGRHGTLTYDPAAGKAEARFDFKF